MLTGCGSTGTNSTETDDSKQEEASVETEEATEAPASTGEETGGDESYNVYLIAMDQAWSNMDEGCQKAVSELGNVKYTWIAPDVKDDAKQIECVNNAVAVGADAILIAANGPETFLNDVNQLVTR